MTAASTGGLSPHQRQCLDVQRLARFAEEQARSLRTEFARLWEPRAGPGEGPLSTLKLHVEQLAAHATRAHAAAEEAWELGPLDGPRRLLQADQNGLAQATRALTPVVAAARKLPLPAAPAVSKAVPLGGLLRRGATARLGARDVLRVPEAPPVDEALGARRREFELACGLVEKVLKYVGSRIHYVKHGLHAIGLPPGRRAWPVVTSSLETVELPANLVPVLHRVTRALYDDADVTRRAHVAVTQYDAADERRQEARAVTRRLPGAPLAGQRALLMGFDLARFRGCVVPLTHLHLTFKDSPVLAWLFPPPQQPPAGGSAGRVGG